MKELLLGRFLQIAAENGTPDIPLDPSDFETSGRIAMSIAAVFLISLASEKFVSAQKLTGDKDVTWTGRAVAASMAMLGLYLAVETATDIPWDQIPL